MPKNYDFYCWCDGACEPKNPGGHMGMGSIIKDRDMKPEFEHSEYRPPIITNTNILAEYGALYFVLKYLVDSKLFDMKILIQADLMLLVNQMTMKRDIVDTGKQYQKVAIICKNMASQFSDINFKWIPREKNQECDDMSKKCLRERGIFESKWRKQSHEKIK